MRVIMHIRRKSKYSRRDISRTGHFDRFTMIIQHSRTVLFIFRRAKLDWSKNSQWASRVHVSTFEHEHESEQTLHEFCITRELSRIFRSTVTSLFLTWRYDDCNVIDYTCLLTMVVEQERMFQYRTIRTSAMNEDKTSAFTALGDCAQCQLMTWCMSLAIYIFSWCIFIVTIIFVTSP